MYTRIRDRYQDVLLLGRQFSHLVRKTGSMEDAMREMRNMGNEKQKALFARFEQAYSDVPSSATLRIGPYATLFRLSDSVKKEGGDYLGVFSQFESMLSGIDEHVRSLWTNMTSFFAYVFAVAAIAMVVSVIMMIFVIPQFAEIFNEMGAELPALTRSLVQHDGLFLQLILVVFAALIGVLFYAIWQILNASANLTTCSRQLQFLPLFRAIAESFHRYLSMNFSLILINSGVEARRALALSSDMAKDQSMGFLANDQSNRASSDVSMQALSLALQADNLPAELEYQIAEQRYRLAEQMQLARVQIMLFIFVLLAIFIGSLVIGMYLPIFKLGAVS